MEIPAPQTTGTLAEQAVAYVLNRVVYDADVRWHMMGTETLRRCLIAEAERTGLPEYEVEARLAKRIKGRRQEKAKLVEARERIEELEYASGNANRINELEGSVEFLRAENKRLQEIVDRMTQQIEVWAEQATEPDSLRRLANDLCFNMV